MYDVALTVVACLRAGTTVHVAWLADRGALSGGDRAEAVVLTPGGGRVGRLLGGVLDDQLADAAASGRSGRLLRLDVGALEAQLAGLAGAGQVGCLLVDASVLPPDLWPALAERQPVRVVAELAGDEVTAVGWSPAEAATSSVALTDERAEAVFVPTPRLVVVGAGPVAEALAQVGQTLGWDVTTGGIGDPDAAAAMVAGLSPLDQVVVAVHDEEISGSALAAALATDAGYIGSLGSRAMQDRRARWLLDAGVDESELARIHGPAGLDLGGRAPGEVAVAICAEALAVRYGSPLGVRT